jgi:AmmeMemoRadiSam system protein B
MCARRRNLAPELLDLRNSGDTAGDKSRVVGYASFAFAEASSSG